MRRLAITLATALLAPALLLAQSNGETQKALAKLKQWQATTGEPIVDEEGRLLYAFGESMPQVICAPLTLCDIKMQIGEEIVSVRVGDKIRWKITPARSGRGENLSEHLIIKPTQAGLKTTLFVGTDRRVYVIELISHKSDFMSKVGFLYQDSSSEPDRSAQSDIVLLPPRVAPVDDVSQITPAPKLDSVDGHEVLAHKLNFDYIISGPNIAWKPVRVYDDGVKTYIDMNNERVSASELPIFLVNDTDQRGNMINYRYVPHDARFIVDGVFDQGSLVIGVGNKRKKIRISRAPSTQSSVVRRSGVGK